MSDNGSPTTAPPAKSGLFDWREYRTGVLIGVTVLILGAVGALFWTGVIDGGSASPTTERSPAEGTTTILAESSQEFFDGAFVVSIGPIRRSGNGLMIGRVHLRQTSVPWPCVYNGGASVGSGLAMRFHNTTYGVEIRELSPSAARVVARRSDGQGDGGCFRFIIGP